MISNATSTSQSTVSDRGAKALCDRPGGSIVIMTAIALTVFSAMAGVAMDSGNRPFVPGISVDDILIDPVGPDGTVAPYRIEVRRSTYEAASIFGTPARFGNQAATLPSMG